MASEGGTQTQLEAERSPEVEKAQSSSEEGRLSEEKQDLPIEEERRQVGLGNLKGVLKFGVEKRGLCHYSRDEWD